MENLIYTIKNFFQNIDKQKVTLLASIIGVMLLIIIAISIGVKLVGSSITYEELEDKLVEATKSYMKDYPTNLPTETNQTAVVSATVLIENKYIKELKKYVKDPSCTANVNVYYNQGDYAYQTYLTCNNFKTEKMVNVLKDNNKISSFGDGLYELNNELVYRGQNPNNYVKFDKKIWRIVKITNNNEILLIRSNLDEDARGVWDDRYNSEADAKKGINTYSLSRLKYNLEKIYEDEYEEYKDLLTTFNICVGKRINATFDKTSLTECGEIINNQKIGLLPVYDYLNASLDNACTQTISEECQNYNYLVNDDGSWWTITGNGKSTYHAYYVSSSGYVKRESADSSLYYRYTIMLNDKVLYSSGNGTKDDPYIFR